MFLRFIKRISFPMLSAFYRWYNTRSHHYSAHGIRLTIHPGVFHPGLFLSTEILIGYLFAQDLHEKKVLELGAGSGLISFYLAKHKGAHVTASDISAAVVRGLAHNAKTTAIPISIVQSDLFESLDPSLFDRIIINPPYYPRNAGNEAEKAFYCGEDFDYFQRLFHQLSPIDLESTHCIMILSEDCMISTIQGLASKTGLRLEEIHRVRKMGEWNMLFALKQSAPSGS